jgi:muconate cycloisomerase
MKVSFRILMLAKRYPFAISRGVITESQNLFVIVEDGGYKGIGECSIGTGDPLTPRMAQSQLESFLQNGIEDCSINDVYRRLRKNGLPGPTMAALEIALWDLHAKSANLPLYRLLGLSKKQVPTSITVGINPPETVRGRVPELLSTGCKSLKIKLGSKDGIEADQASFEVSRQAALPFNVKLRVDANGGWSLSDAKIMLQWLADRDVDYVEQPLAKGAEDQLPELFNNRPIPIFVDESVEFAADVPKLAHTVDGINLKLMKCGGIAEAMRIVAVARALSLQTMIGCMSESSVGIAAGAAIGALFDHIDLDSHLNLNPDPAEGLDLIDGVVTPRETPGHGAWLKHA